ncbi:hypothetical protein EG346_06975 [Chryseobacterium carnipullorum]|uniref:QacE n=1 Tax=Chryseobacterium carnipullorum TaxID=1124835 RepID=A0A1M7A0H1_CHRCU|nr:DUF6232 family protein [Chryseobacterium carnipullorum]AZA47949.1 hypothetical protein EG346_06975 [Chryseobacterium carnipullorum]AZA67264.1 hypothetical protein EG345_23145 [Chryseobacterium carnipullorum]SHL36204.1 hypothetical protein SAMN05444360_101271 [Chryseobacterium carnipullorum]STD12967.1 Uncharacterised protein [Chryseobacterium carnipullorum]HBV17791.1 hypothetical protein [Chryseobacterium carnipullorum]
MENLQSTGETTFYKDINVIVTQSRYVTQSKTYAMRNISSVHVFEIIKSRRFPLILIVIGILLLFSGDTRIVGTIFAVIGAVILFLTKNEYAVRISTNSGEANSIISKDKIYIQKIVNALNQAIIHRG